MSDLVPRQPDRSIDLIEQALATTPARLLAGRAGPGYRTMTWLKLRGDHAAARDAVHADLDLLGAFGQERADSFLLFEARSRAGTRAEYLLRPDLGRCLDDDSRQKIAAGCPTGVDLQVVIGDGLSAAAVAGQAPPLLDLLRQSAHEQGWRFGRPFLVRHCRVGVMNEVGELTDAAVVVLLIGERPGLAAADSLSAYLAYRPRPGDTDAERNLISNIHGRGVDVAHAAARIMALADSMRRLRKSGVGVKEEAVPARSFPA